MMNGIALVALGVYGGAVIFNGKAGDLFTAMGEEGDFLVWFAAVGVVVAIYRSDVLPPLGKGLSGLAIVALAMKIAGNASVVSLMKEATQGGLTWDKVRTTLFT